MGVIWLAGCGGPDHEAFCQKSEDCRDGNEKDVAACVATLDYAEEVSSDQGCSDEYDALIACYDEHASCQGNNYQLKDQRDCQVETNAFGHCADVNLEVD